MAKARDVAAAVNAACSNAEYAEMEALRKSRADAADAAASLAALKVVGEGSGLKAIAKENAEKEAAATAVASSPAESDGAGIRFAVRFGEGGGSGVWRLWPEREEEKEPSPTM